MSLSILMLMALAVQTEAASETQLNVPAVCKVEQEALQGISSKYDGEIKLLSEEGDELERRGHQGHHVGTEVTFKSQDFSFDVPSVTMKANRFVISIPSTTMRTRKISFNIVEIVMKQVKVGEYPETRCRPWPPSCTVTWHPIYTSVPEPRSVTKEISTDIPEIRMQRNEVISNFPEVKMNRVKWSTKIPEFKLESPIPQEPDPDLKADGQRLQERGASLSNRVDVDVAEATSKLYSCLGSDLVEKRKTAAFQFDIAINQLTAAIDTISAQKADPSAVVDADGKTVNYVQQRADLISTRDEALAKIDAAIEQLSKAKQSTVSKALSS